MQSSNHCTGGGGGGGVAISFVVIQWSFSNMDLDIPCIHDAEEKESMTMVRSKVTSEHGILANGGVLTVKRYRIYIQKLL